MSRPAGGDGLLLLLLLLAAFWSLVELEVRHRSGLSRADERKDAHGCRELAELPLRRPLEQDTIGPSVKLHGEDPLLTSDRKATAASESTAPVRGWPCRFVTVELPKFDQIDEDERPES
ncbi:unnamed protein product [Heligmosomoides polygyrus]|uniref:Uncharacterized protein n=1 Tax=Heligmosomoides polygyrus TaxID=6339 RepID=A0A183GHT9_HELPZ|nr:unnamed protein product [Heligmosomoides polygyrus]